jgi:hypothetical protein
MIYCIGQMHRRTIVHPVLQILLPGKHLDIISLKKMELMKTLYISITTLIRYIIIN